MGKRELFISNDKISGYNLNPTTDTSSKPTAQVPPKGPSRINQQEVASMATRDTQWIHVKTYNNHE